MKQILKNTLAILNQHEKRNLGSLILFNVIISVADIASLALLILIINFYAQTANSINPPWLPDWLFNRHSLLPIILFLVFFSVKNLAGYYIHQAQYRFVYNVAARLSEKNLLQFLQGTFVEYTSIDSAVQIRKISQQPIEFSHYVLAGIQQIITQAILIALTIIAIFLYNAALFLLLLVILLPPVILIAWLIKKRSKSTRIHAKTSSEKALQHLKEALSGFIESNIYDKHSFFVDRYTSYQQKLNSHLSQLQAVQGMPNRLIEVFAVLGLFLLITISHYTGSTNAISIMTLGAFMGAAYKIMPGVVKILNHISQVKAYEFTVNDLRKQRVDTLAINCSGLKTNIQSVKFKNVSFKYPDHSILGHFNFCVQAGDFLGISGLSGKGKTTVINLLLDFIKPHEGKIIFNNKAADDFPAKHFWKNISYVKQQPFLIHDTVLSNITLDGKWYNSKKLNEILKATGLKELISKYPEGLNKIVTENGKNISGGQRQRIVIARALYKEADLIILDEPFNELDHESEHLMLSYFQNLALSGKLIILITHNKKSLSYCSKIISLDED